MRLCFFLMVDHGGPFRVDPCSVVMIVSSMPVGDTEADLHYGAPASHHARVSPILDSTQLRAQIIHFNCADQISHRRTHSDTTPVSHPCR